MGTSKNIQLEGLTLEQMPSLLCQLFLKIERIEHFTCNQISEAQQKELPKHVDINGASVITSKTPNALRVQISLGNLKSTKKGSRHYFEREYLERWIAGDQNDEGVSK